jgi:hypothetical protein
MDQSEAGSEALVGIKNIKDGESGVLLFHALNHMQSGLRWTCAAETRLVSPLH